MSNLHFSICWILGGSKCTTRFVEKFLDNKTLRENNKMLFILIKSRSNRSSPHFCRTFGSATVYKGVLYWSHLFQDEVWLNFTRYAVWTKMMAIEKLFFLNFSDDMNIKFIWDESTYPELSIGILFFSFCIGSKVIEERKLNFSKFRDV